MISMITLIPLKEKVVKKRRLIQAPDSDEEEISTQASDVTMEESASEPMQVETAPAQESTDEAFDKEIEQAAIEEKNAKKDKIEMMSIIHSM